MRLIEALTRNPETIAVAVICVMLGIGNAAPHLSGMARLEGKRVRIGLHQIPHQAPAELARLPVSRF